MENAEINEAVARKLGWAIDKTSDFLPWYGKPGGRPESSMIRDLPDYCHSIDAAWEVVEFWLTSEIRFRTFEMKKNNASHWYIQFTQENDGHIYDSVADTAPMAICRAFLKVGEK